VIRLTSVSKELGRSGPVLRNLTFEIRKGEFAFLTGHSGAGKSTLLRLLRMEDLPSFGEVRVAGYSSARITTAEIPMLRRKLGVVFQDFRLLPDRTAERNVSFALEVTGAPRRGLGARVGRLLMRVGLASRANALPEQLSGGEQQRVAIARALANEPLILLADEPTGNLDPWSARGIFDLFRELNASGMTVVMATHDLELVRAHPAARVLELKCGELVFDSGCDPVREAVS
jgi:cell division transport system ATP-binding protein